MDWKQIVMPPPLRTGVKWARRCRTSVVARLLNLGYRAGLPPVVALGMRERNVRARVVLYKQGILSLAGPDWFYRYSRARSGVPKLRREYEGWKLLQNGGLRDIVVSSMRLNSLGDGLLLESPLLRPIELEEQAEASLPIWRALVESSRPVRHSALPPTIAAGLEVARGVCDGAVPASFISEAMLTEAFSDPLLTGISHNDLHVRNVMRDWEGRPLLIDLKSCAPDRVLALDILMFGCKYMCVRNRLNVVENAFALQQRGWKMPGLEQILALIDLPRPLWGPIVTLHAIGQVTMKKAGRGAANAVVGKLLRGRLQGKWRESDTPATSQGSVAETSRLTQ